MGGLCLFLINFVSCSSFAWEDWRDGGTCAARGSSECQEQIRVRSTNSRADRWYTRSALRHGAPCAMDIRQWLQLLQLLCDTVATCGSNGAYTILNDPSSQSRPLRYPCAAPGWNAVEVLWRHGRSKRAARRNCREATTWWTSCRRPWPHGGLNGLMVFSAQAFPGPVARGDKIVCLIVSPK